MTIETPEPTDRFAKARDAKKQKAVVDLVEKEVERALAKIRSLQTEAAKKDPKDMTEAELRAEHDRLQAALEALPYVGEKAPGTPGTVIGEGLTREYVAYTSGWFLDVEARRQDRNFHNGQPAELTWPNYGIHEVIYPGPKVWLDISVNGVTFTVLPGIPCKLPTPHYAKYMDHIRGGRLNDERFAQPERPGTAAGYMHVNAKTGLAVLLGKGPLPSTEEREAGDVKPA